MNKKSKHKYIEISCDYCSIEFLKGEHHYKNEKKNGYNCYCSKECRINAKTVCIVKPCLTCKKDYKQPCSDSIFCSRSCAAIFNNKKFPKGKKLSKEQKIQNQIKRNKNKNKEDNICVICKKLFFKQRKNHFCCSRACGKIYQFGNIISYTKEEILILIKLKFNELKRTPQQREIDKRLLQCIRTEFKKYSLALIEAGITPNNFKYQKTITKTKDGHLVDSISESYIDNFLFKNNIEHELHKIYPIENRQLKCDFYLPKYGVWIEYFGLKGKKEYDKASEEKIILIKNFTDKFIFLEPTDLYPMKDHDKNLTEKILKFLNKLS